MLHRSSSRWTLFVAALALLGYLLGLPAHDVRAQAQPGVDCSTASASSSVDADPTSPRIAFTNQCGVAVPLGVDVAADFATQERGLMNDATLPADQGELFVFNNISGGNEVQVGFWMKDTPIDLSIAFIGGDFVVRDILDMQAETLDIHIPPHPYLYAVEAHQGWFASHGITAGSRVDLSPALSQLPTAPGP